MSHRAIALVIAVVLSTSVLAQMPARSAPIDHRHYVHARQSANAREQRAIDAKIKDVRKRGQDTLSPYIRGTSPARVLNRAVGILQEEARILAYMKTLADGKSIGGDPNANIRQAVLDGQRAFGQAKTVDQEQVDSGRTLVRLAMQPSLADAVEYQRVIIGLHEHVIAAAQHFEQTMDVYLSALGGPSIAETFEARRVAAARTEMQQRMRRAREQEAAEVVFKAVGGATVELFSAIAETVAERDNVSTADVGAGWPGTRNVFHAVGLDEGALLKAIHDGTYGPTAGDLRGHFALEAYVVKFSNMCRSSLPPDAVELKVVHTEELVTKNLLGWELSRLTVGQYIERTGVYAAPVFARALLRVSISDQVAILGQLFGGSGDSVPLISGTAKLARMSARFRRDFRRLISRHGCDGPVLTRLADNLVRIRTGL